MLGGKLLFEKLRAQKTDRKRFKRQRFFLRSAASFSKLQGSAEWACFCKAIASEMRSCGSCAARQAPELKLAF